MRIPIHVLLATAVLSTISAAEAQQDEEVSIIRAAIASLRTELPKGALMIDSDTYRASPVLGERVAVALLATRGRIGDVRQCDGPRQPRRRLHCSMLAGATLVAFTQPAIRDTIAQVTIGWWYPEAPGVVAHKFVELKLVRNADGTWEVTDWLSRGMT
jgi:hypothetical protein